MAFRVSLPIRDHIDKLARVTRRSKSFVIEEALENYLDINEWQIQGIQNAIAAADSPNADFTDHDDVVAIWEAKIAR
jgi:predicted transcriptional regulator